MARFKRFVATEEITPGNTETYKIPSGRLSGLHVRLTGTTDTGQTLALSEIGTFRLQRDGRTIQSESFEFYSDFNDLTGGFPEATLPTAGATAVSCFIPFFAPRLPNTMEVVSEDELKLFFEPAAGLATEFGSNAISVEVNAIIETEVAESYELEVNTQDFAASATGRRSIPLNHKNNAYVFLVDAGGVVSTVQIDVDGATREPAIDIDSQAAFASFEWRIETNGNTLIPYNIGSRSELGSYLNESVTLLPTFTSTGTLEITLFNIMPSPAGRPQISADRVRQALSNNRQIASQKLAAFRRG